jgi:hypothetical protein
VRMVSNLAGVSQEEVCIGLPVTVEFEPCEAQLAVPVFRPGGRRERRRRQSRDCGPAQTEFSREAGRSETRLATEAILAALADGGLAVADAGGLVSYIIDQVEETELVRGLGIPEIRWSSWVPYGAGITGRATARGSGRRRRLPGGEGTFGHHSGTARAGIGPSSSHPGTTAGQ